MEKVIIYNNIKGTFSQMAPANNVYVPADKDPLEHADFITPVTKATPEEVLIDFLDGKPPVPHRLATIDEIAARDVPAMWDAPDGVEWHIVDVEHIREVTGDSRYFRDAWQHDNGVVSISMEKAREIHKEKLRQQRTSLLAALDIETMRALAAKDDAAIAEIEERKQALRDITDDPAIASAKTPEALQTAALTTLKI